MAERFRDRFWVDGPHGRHPALALDAAKRPVDSLTSNIGHLLGTGMLTDAETEAISRLLGVHVQRLATLAGGAHVCTTFIPTSSVSRSGTPSAHDALELTTPNPERAPR